MSEQLFIPFVVVVVQIKGENERRNQGAVAKVFLAGDVGQSGHVTRAPWCVVLQDSGTLAF
jgi:hypothetical protein